MKQAGFEYIEVGVQGVLRGEASDAEWAATAPDPARSALPIEAANGLVPGKLPIVGPQRDSAQLRAYMQRVAQRARRVGIQRLVFGSGAARKRPEGVSPEQASEHITDFARMAAEVCGEQGVVVVIEHLNQKETNTLNKLAESRQLCDRVGHPGLRVLVDSYHYGLEHETDDAILKLGDRLQHVHVAEVTGRIQPGGHGPVAPGSPAFDFAHFFCLLRKAGYDQRVSFEGKWAQPLPEAGPACVAYLRRCWDQAGEAEG